MFWKYDNMNAISACDSNYKECTSSGGLITCKQGYFKSTTSTNLCIGKLPFSTSSPSLAPICVLVSYHSLLQVHH